MDETFTPDNSRLSEDLDVVKSWRRIGDICADLNVRPVLFNAEVGEANAVSPADIHQGQLNDCFLLAALSALAKKPTLLKSLFPTIGSTGREQEYNEAGIYAVRFFRHGAWATEIVDDYFPCNILGMPVTVNLELDDNGAGEFWPLVVEKAYAKMCGGYSIVDEGGSSCNCLADLTGGTPLRFAVAVDGSVTTHDKGHPWTGSVQHQHDELFRFLRLRTDDCEAGDDLICCSIQPDKQEGSGSGSANWRQSTDLSSHHAYAVLAVAEVQRSHFLGGEEPMLSFEEGATMNHSMLRLVRVRNPWVGRVPIPFLLPQHVSLKRSHVYYLP